MTQGLQWSLNVWPLLTVLIALLIALPILVVLGSVFTNRLELWRHLIATVLLRYLLNSCLLSLGVSVGVLLIGISTAWLVTLCQFPGHRIYEWALLLPLATPAYLLAYTYTDWLEYYGPIQTQLRDWFGWQTVQDYWFPEIRSLWGAILLLSLTLYPYVYLLARVAFLEQSICTLEASRNLGCNPWQSFWDIALPLARPAITAGWALALMETLNDFGTVQYFGVDTFTTGIYRTWFGMGEPTVAAQLSALLLTLILGLIVVERWARRRTRYYQRQTHLQAIQPYRLRGWRSLGAQLACSLPILLGIVVPGGILAQMAWINWQETVSAQFWQLSQHSLMLASITALLGLVLALLLAYGVRLQPSRLVAASVRLAAMGYAIPGTVVAVGLLIPLGTVDNALSESAQAVWGRTTGLFLSGTAIALIAAYLIRFLAVALSTVESSLVRVTPSLDEAARSLGATPTDTLIRIHVPLLKGGLLTAIVLVFVDVMKELPATLILRPFNFDTLAIRVYQYASDERLAAASAPALSILLVGLIPVMILSRQIAAARDVHSHS
ncbi:MAG: iron ABC transporter permease [Cyanobacteria bacterium P01_H01_bin.121]